MQPPLGIHRPFLRLVRLDRALALAFAFAVLAAGFPQKAQAVPVDLELALLVDVSGSVSAAEWATQRDGYVAALTDPAFLNAVTSGDIGAVALSFWYWSGSTQQLQAVGWTLVTDAASALAFATDVQNAARPFFGLTAPGSAIDAAVATFAGNGFEGNFLKIDVSGDGAANSGSDTATAVQNALAAGIDQVNGLPIGNQTLIDWYAANVLGGAGAFNQPATTFADFQPALLLKLQREVTESSPVPEPASLFLLGGALLTGVWLGRRRISR